MFRNASRRWTGYKLWVFLLAGTLATLSPGVSKAGPWIPIYTEDFSTDPGWTTNDPGNLGRDAVTNTFHGWQSNTNTSYAFIMLPGFDPTKSFKLEFDSKINSVQWSAGLTFGLWDSRMMDAPSSSLGYGMKVDYSLVDDGRRVSMWSGSPDPSGGVSQVTNWLTGIWYHNNVEWDEVTGQITYRVTNPDGSTRVVLSEITPSFPADMNRLGVSRLFMEGYTSNAVDYNLDNLVLSQIPEPASLILLAVGGFGLLVRRQRGWSR